MCAPSKLSSFTKLSAFRRSDVAGTIIMKNLWCCTWEWHISVISSSHLRFSSSRMALMASGLWLWLEYLHLLVHGGAMNSSSGGCDRSNGSALVRTSLPAISLFSMPITPLKQRSIGGRDVMSML